MKRILIPVLLLIAVVCKAQRIDLSNMIAIVNKPSSSINDALILNGWGFYQKGAADKNNYYTVTWNYKLDSDSLAKEWLDVRIHSGRIVGAMYQFNDLYTLKSIMSEFVNLGAYKHDSKTHDDRITSTYYSKDYVYQIDTYKSDTKGCKYSVYVIPKKNYLNPEPL